TLNFLLSAQASYAKSESNVGEAILKLLEEMPLDNDDLEKLPIDLANQLSVISEQLSVINSIIVHHSIIPTTVNGGGALRRIVSLKLKQKFWPSNAPYVCLDVVKFSLDKGDLT
ncbi:MAG: hypothetical protein ACKPJN_03515, partial [Microcystis panniformis]